MSQKITVYWRDIPSQVIVKRGRNRGKAVLSQRFQEAIDDAAMKAGKAGTDDYVEEWHRVTVDIPKEGEINDQAFALAEEYETAYPDERLKTLVTSGGVDEEAA